MRDLSLPDVAWPAACQASKTAFRSHCARPTGRYMCVSEASCPNFEPRANARLTGLTSLPRAARPSGRFASQRETNLSMQSIERAGQ